MASPVSPRRRQSDSVRVDVAASTEAASDAPDASAFLRDLDLEVHPSWADVVAKELGRREGRELLAFVSAARRSATVFPRHSDVFAALRLTPLDRVSVVILGQDPYHGPGQAHGLAFSVPRSVAAPPSLRNILEEASGERRSGSGSGDLSGWALQGVLLLNTVLTVEKARPGSHAGRGWEAVTTALLRHVSRSRTGVVFMLWGKPAQELRASSESRAALVVASPPPRPALLPPLPVERPGEHLVLEAPHPSPLSAYRGFKGCGHFAAANEYLARRGGSRINWDVDFRPPTL